MGWKSKILVVDDEALVRDGLKAILDDEGYAVAVARTGEEAIAALNREYFNLAIVDLKLPGMDGMELLEKVKERKLETEVVVITGHGSISSTVEAIKKGAYYYITKPFSPEELLVIVDKALEHQYLVTQSRRLKEQLRIRYGFKNIVGKSTGMQKVYELIEAVAESDSTVFIIGETGTGKELIANALHYHSRRADKPFIKVNCAALPEELLESELFGHEKGAFTGAQQQKPGRFERADGGSLFLDEVCEMSPRLQAKLLRVLQNGEFERLGGTRTLKVDVRIIAATNRDPQKAVEQGVLREDLYYRLNVFPIRVPPLRERKGDIPLLANHFLEKFRTKMGKEIEGISSEAINRLIRYDWPGNVRELENAIERAVILSSGSLLLPQDFPQLQSSDITITPPLPYPISLDNLEKQAILQTLQATNWNKQEAANILGIHRTTLYDKMKKYGISDKIPSNLV